VTGAELITAERQRQIDVEGWTPKHDTQYWDGDLAMAAICYAWPPYRRKLLFPTVPTLWPWRSVDWKPSPDDRIRELVKAGALIAAEIDRLQAQNDVKGVTGK
jgi:hypothetical protein